MDVPINHGDFPWLCKRLLEGILVKIPSEAVGTIGRPQVVVAGSAVLTARRHTSQTAAVGFCQTSSEMLIL